MKRTSLLLALAALPAIANAQIKIARPTTQVARPQLAVKEPSMYIFDHYTLNNRDFLMHYMDDFAAAAHSSEPFTGGIQGMGSDRFGNVYAAIWVGPSAPTYVMQMRKAGKFTGPLKRALDVATDTEGRLYIIDADLGQVVRIDDLTGKNLVAFGSPGTGIGQFKNPSGIAVDRAGHVYIADTGNSRIVRIDDMNGEGWRTYDGAAYAGMGKQVIFPKSIAVDSRGRLYYLRPDNGYINRVDDLGGKNVVSWGGAAGAPGSGYFLVEPYDMAIDAQDRIYVTDHQTGWITRIDDMTGVNRATLYKDASGNLFKRPEVIAVFYPRPDNTVIR